MAAFLFEPRDSFDGRRSSIPDCAGNRKFRDRRNLWEIAPVRRAEDRQDPGESRRSSQRSAAKTQISAATVLFRSRAPPGSRRTLTKVSKVQTILLTLSRVAFMFAPRRVDEEAPVNAKPRKCG